MLIQHRFNFRYVKLKMVKLGPMSYNEESSDGIEDCDVAAERRRVAENDADDVLKIDALTKVFASFSRRQKVVAVDGVTLGIHRGEVSH